MKSLKTQSVEKFNRLADKVHHFGLTFEYFRIYNDTECEFEKPKYENLIEYLNEGALDVIEFLNYIETMRRNYEKSWGGELAPCPFCGNIHCYIQDFKMGSRTEYGAQCDNCEVSMRYYPTRDEARERWNTRNMFEYRSMLGGWDTEEDLPNAEIKVLLWPWSRVIENVRRYPYYHDATTGEKMYVGADISPDKQVKLSDVEELNRLLDIERDKTERLLREVNRLSTENFELFMSLVAANRQLPPDKKDNT